MSVRDVSGAVVEHLSSSTNSEPLTYKTRWGMPVGSKPSPMQQNNMLFQSEVSIPKRLVMTPFQKIIDLIS